MNTNLTVYDKMPAERVSKFKRVFIFKWLANLRDLLVLEDPPELNFLYARLSSHADCYILGSTDVGLQTEEAKSLLKRGRGGKGDWETGE
ncbi:MAG: hypothetical protein QNJ72_36625 [Pleurocapsa sp. MO_226.B13]|nr:hypothetical protein [Pleurocapsa sp. MO_226.B13]